jgi:hypothetical protein
MFLQCGDKFWATLVAVAQYDERFYDKSAIRIRTSDDCRFRDRRMF